MADYDAINKKIKESPNPMVEWIIQNCVYNWTHNSGGVASAVTSTPTSKTPAPAVEKPKPKSSSSAEEAPITDIFGNNDGW
jgi:hypothetical protein